MAFSIHERAASVAGLQNSGRPARTPRTTKAQMTSRPPESPAAQPAELPAESTPTPERLKKQKAASLALYIGLVLLALWVARDFIVVVAWAGVVSIALWPLLR
jgi:hypothetical protein